MPQLYVLVWTQAIRWLLKTFCKLQMTWCQIFFYIFSADLIVQTLVFLKNTFMSPSCLSFSSIAIRPISCGRNWKRRKLSYSLYLVILNTVMDIYASHLCSCFSRYLQAAWIISWHESSTSFTTSFAMRIRSRRFLLYILWTRLARTVCATWWWWVSVMRTVAENFVLIGCIAIYDMRNSHDKLFALSVFITFFYLYRCHVSRRG